MPYEHRQSNMPIAPVSPRSIPQYQPSPRSSWSRGLRIDDRDGSHQPSLVRPIEDDNKCSLPPIRDLLGFQAPAQIAYVPGKSTFRVVPTCSCFVLTLLQLRVHRNLNCILDGERVPSQINFDRSLLRRSSLAAHQQHLLRSFLRPIRHDVPVGPLYILHLSRTRHLRIQCMTWDDLTEKDTNTAEALHRPTLHHLPGLQLLTLHPQPRPWPVRLLASVLATSLLPKRRFYQHLRHFLRNGLCRVNSHHDFKLHRHTHPSSQPP